MAAVIAIYARENGAGMMFEPEPAYEEGYTPSLVDDEQQDGSSASATEGLSLVKDETQAENPSSPDDDPGASSPNRSPIIACSEINNVFIFIA